MRLYINDVAVRDGFQIERGQGVLKVGELGASVIHVLARPARLGHDSCQGLVGGQTLLAR